MPRFLSFFFQYITFFPLRQALIFHKSPFFADLSENGIEITKVLQIFLFPSVEKSPVFSRKIRQYPQFKRLFLLIVSKSANPTGENEQKIDLFSQKNPI